jgi:hypothetical protein
MQLVARSSRALTCGCISSLKQCKTRDLMLARLHAILGLTADDLLRPKLPPAERFFLEAGFLK